MNSPYNFLFFVAISLHLNYNCVNDILLINININAYCIILLKFNVHHMCLLSNFAGNLNNLVLNLQNFGLGVSSVDQVSKRLHKKGLELWNSYKTLNFKPKINKLFFSLLVIVINWYVYIKKREKIIYKREHNT